MAAATIQATPKATEKRLVQRFPNGRLTFNLFGSIGQFERENMLERQKVGIAAAKAEGKYAGRAPTAQAKSAKVLALHAKGLTKQEIANACEIGVASPATDLRDGENHPQGGL